MRTARTKFGIKTVSSTALSVAFAGMAEGEFLEFTSSNFSFDFVDDSSTSASTLAWTTKAPFDEYTRKAYFWGRGHQGDGHGCIYDEVTNTWSHAPGNEPPAGWNHAYDHFTIQQRPGQPGIIYAGDYGAGASVVQTHDLDTDTWDTLPSISTPLTITQGIEWFPDLYTSGGLVHANGRKISTWDADNPSSWTNHGDYIPDDPYHIIATYLPDDEVVLFSPGNGGGGTNPQLALHKIDSSGTITQLNDLPVALGCGLSGGSFFALPGKKPTAFGKSGNYSSGPVFRVWEYDYATDSWANAGHNEVHDDYAGSNEWVVGIKMEVHGGIMFMVETSSSAATLVLYKPRSKA